MKLFQTILFTVFASSITMAQDIDITGLWEIEGAIMGEPESGWVMPHKQAAPDCDKDYSFFAENHTGRDVKYNQDCETTEITFDWKLEGNQLTLTGDNRSIVWHIVSLKDDVLRVGIQPRPDSENKMYVSYKKKS